MHPCLGWAQHCLRWETVAHAHTHCKEGVGTPMRSCPDERRRYPAGSGPHRHKGQTQAPGSWPSPSRHTRPQPRGSRREGPRCAVHHPHALPWPGNDSLVAPDRGDAGTGGSGRMLEQGYLATLCYLSPNSVAGWVMFFADFEAKSVKKYCEPWTPFAPCFRRPSPASSPAVRPLGPRVASPRPGYARRSRCPCVDRGGGAGIPGPDRPRWPAPGSDE
jgi:hypothetical protein